MSKYARCARLANFYVIRGFDGVVLKWGKAKSHFFLNASNCEVALVAWQSHQQARLLSVA